MEIYLEKIGAKNRLRDPLYGFVYITDAEKKIIDTSIFQRLRRIHQLALTKYVYPSAEHSRFVHSIGVMHCATLILSGVREHSRTNSYTEYSDKALKILRFAALLHDIGHLPFSHAVEKQWLSGLKHEDLSQYIILHHPEIVSIMKSEGVDPRVVSSLLAKTPIAQWRLFHEIISGQLDADRADYLLRDSHCCGVRYGEYDFIRFMRIFAAIESEDGLVLSIDDADLHVAESMLIARYHANMQIPYHRTRSGYDFALKRFVKDFDEYNDVFKIEEGRIVDVDFRRFEDLDDYTIIERAKKERYENANEWADYILRKKHLVPISDTRRTWAAGLDDFKKICTLLRQSDDFVENEDFFVQEMEIELLKGTDQDIECPVEVDGVPEDNNHCEFVSSCGIKLMPKKWNGDANELVDITSRSWIFKHVTAQPEAIYRVYVKPEREADAQKLLLKVEQ
jgi:HD superfamily phosphohydrolase